MRRVLDTICRKVSKIKLDVRRFNDPCKRTRHKFFELCVRGVDEKSYVCRIVLAGERGGYLTKRMCHE